MTIQSLDSGLKRNDLTRLYHSQIKARILDLDFLSFVSNFFGENYIFPKFVKARLTGLASRKFKMKTDQDREIDFWKGNFCSPL